MSTNAKNELSKDFDHWTTSELSIRLSLLKRTYRVLMDNKRVSWTESETCRIERLWLKQQITITQSVIKKR